MLSVKTITNYYRNNGYILSRVRIIEGYIGNVSVASHSYGAQCLVQRIGNKIKNYPALIRQTNQPLSANYCSALGSY